MANKKVQINICSYDEMLQIRTIGRAIAIRIWELTRVRAITPELLATITYIKMEVVNQYINYTSLNEFQFEEQDNEFEDQDELDYEQQDDLVDFDDRMKRASESDKVKVQHDILQHQSWLELPFDKLKI
jgi:predicted DNA-binding helix-hairpin-helix protein